MTGAFALLVAFGLGFIGTIPLLLAKKWVPSLIAGIIYTLIGWWIVYATAPMFSGPLMGAAFWFLLVWWLISAIYAAVSDTETSLWLLFTPSGLSLIVLIFTAISGLGLFRSSDYAQLIGSIEDKTEKHWTQDVQPLDPAHIRLVPKELAVSLAKTILGQDGSTLGSQFPLSADYATLQKINDEYWYLIPLDYSSWTVWTKADFIPAYVKVNATDPYARPILVTGQKLKYTPGAYFNRYLKRKIASKYYGKKFSDLAFEEDDNGHPYWVYSVSHPTISFGGQVVDGVVIVDPETGEDTFVSIKELEAGKHAWIDRVIPSSIIKEYIDQWGSFKDGWWNSFWTQVNLLKSETPTMNYSTEGVCVFVSPVTSSSSDETMTGLMYVNARTGKFTYYKTNGGATEEAVINAVNSATSYKKWHASEQIIYENVAGKLVSLVPVLGENGNYQGLAIVQNDNKRVALGATPQEALIEFRKSLALSGGQISTDNNRDILSYQGKVTRIGWDITSSGKQYYLYFSSFDNSFAVNSVDQSELALTKEGDMVLIKYIASDQLAVPTVEFKNVTLNLKKSESEKSVAKQTTDRQEKVQVKADASDIRSKISEMSDAELVKALQK